MPVSYTHLDVYKRQMYREVFEGAMVCLICPTATAAAVITPSTNQLMK